jgi:hypothetical protein
MTDADLRAAWTTPNRTASWHNARHNGTRTMLCQRCAGTVPALCYGRLGTVPMCRHNLIMTANLSSVLHLMLSAGLSDELVGRAARELLLGASAEAKPRPPATPWAGLTPGTPRATQAGAASDLPTPPALTAGQAREKGGLGATASTSVEATRSAQASEELVPVKVRFPGGAATNVVVPRKQLSALARSLGGEDAARGGQRTRRRREPLALGSAAGPGVP